MRKTLKSGLRALSLVTLASCSAAAICAGQGAAQTVTPMYGNISPFYGNLSPFYGNLSPFYGNLSPFYGNLSPFWGNLSPFYGNLSPFWGNLSPFTATTNASLTSVYGTTTDPFWGGGGADPYTNNPSKYVNYSAIAGFWQTEAANWKTVQAAWSNASLLGNYSTVAALLQNTIINPANAFWGPAINAAKSGKAPTTITVGQVFANAGVTFNSDGSINAASLANVSPTQQAALFLGYYDVLMSYSGTPHVDWWMGSAHWSPALAADAVSSSNKAVVTVGMLDFTVTNNQKDAKGTLLQYGSSVFSNGHGAAVGSLIMGSVDGSGIMGVMPSGSANVIVYDPYDSTNTTNWTDVGTGIQVLANATFKKNGAPTGVLNASLGVPGWTLNPGWNTALSSGAAADHILVIAAGNEGVTQTTNVPWTFAKNPDIIIVGSVGVNGGISNFSNKPGEACLIDTAATSSACVEADKLKYRFITAPGELILVSDGAGGFSRQSGTSLAAPLVSGAIALLQARWPWLANYPDETSQIILKSATPMGTNPGADPVYGVGELNIQASQSPLSWNSLQYYPVTNGKASTTPVSVAGLVSLVSSGNQSSWNSSKLYVSAIENIGKTYRDFQIPLASTLVGQSVATANGSQLFQSYLAVQMKTWIANGAHFADDDVNPAVSAVAGFAQSSVSLGRVNGMDFRMSVTPSAPAFGYRQGAVDGGAQMALIGSNSSFRFGYGGGAEALGGQAGFAETSDYQVDRGGANPLLGLASGGAFADWRGALTNKLAFNLGVTQRRDLRDPMLFGFTDQASPATVYEASAEHFGLDYAASSALTLHASITQLQENSALLGVQALSAAELGKGSSTTGVSFGFDWGLGRGYTLSASAMAADTTLPSNQGLRTGSGGLQSSAGEVALTKAGLFANTDRVRLTLSKSMQVDSGELRYSTYGVVDRQSGALGVIDESSNAGNGRVPVSAELLYGRLLPSQNADISFFVRAEAGQQDVQFGHAYDYVGGAKYHVVF